MLEERAEELAGQAALPTGNTPAGMLSLMISTLITWLMILMSTRQMLLLADLVMLEVHKQQQQQQHNRMLAHMGQVHFLAELSR